MQVDTTPTVVRPSDVDGRADPTTSSPLVRAVLVVVGTVALVLGVVGIFLPILPTTPFLLVTAACYARASTRLYRWLLDRTSMGPVIVEWRRSRSLTRGVKMRALALVLITFAISIVLIDSALLRVGLVVTGVILVTFLLRIPATQLDGSSVTMSASTTREES